MIYRVNERLIMDPYRVNIVKVEPKSKPRSWFKTKIYRLLLWYKGPWKSRFTRCKKCAKGLKMTSEYSAINECFRNYSCGHNQFDYVVGTFHEQRKM